jgi:anti-sigma regulatory factor (Ser/Thr protein kinase)
MSFGYTTDLAAVRAVVYRYAKQAGLAEHRAIDLVLAVSEVAANTVRHARSPGSLKIWYDTQEIVCQIQDEGTIRDPLAGQRKPSLDAMGGHGLWIVQEVCDDVEMQSDETGTTIRPAHEAAPAKAGLLTPRLRAGTVQAWPTSARSSRRPGDRPRPACTRPYRRIRRRSGWPGVSRGRRTGSGTP